MNSFPAARDQNDLDLSLQTLVATHGYAVVQNHLQTLAAATAAAFVPTERQADPRYLLSLPPEQRERILAAAVEDALPLYEADQNRPESERELTADFETGDLYEEYDASLADREHRHA